jgi:hypothetical protein
MSKNSLSVDLHTKDRIRKRIAKTIGLKPKKELWINTMRTGIKKLVPAIK